MELLKKLKTAEIPKNDTEENEIKYLEDTNLNQIVNKGLAELYRIQPENPIIFLVNFLLNENHSKEILKKFEDDKNNCLKIQEKIKNNEEYLQKIQEEQQQKENEFLAQKEELRNFIKNSQDLDKDLNEICEKLKNILNATGVYISEYSLKRKKVESIDEDENSHIDPENINVLRFIHWNNDHDFLHNKIIPPKKGVTYPLFMEVIDDEEDEEGGGEKPEKQEGNNEDEGEEEEEKEDTKEKELKSVEIQDVINDNKIKFFREPRLGSYLAYNISYQSSLSFKSLLSSIQNLEEFNKKNEEYEKLKAEKEEQDKLNKENNPEEKPAEEEEEEEEDNKDDNKGEEEEGEEGEEGENKLVKPILKDFEKEEKILIIAMDTLGQDRTFSEDEKAFSLEIAKLLKNSFELLEKNLIEKDRDLRIEYLKQENVLKEEWNADKIESEQENAVREYESSEEYLNKNVTDEAQKAVEDNYAKANWIIQNLISTDFMQLLETFSKFEFVQYEKVFQNIFYFAHIEPQLINEEETNKLSWKKAREHWMGLFDILKDYTPLGAKPDNVLSIFKGNKILENLEPFLTEENVEPLKEYSYTLFRLLTYVVEILKVRKSDILFRHADQRNKIKERNEIIKENKKIDEERKKALKKAKKNFGKKEGEEEEKEEEEKKEGEGEEEEGEGEENEEGEGEENEEEKEKEEKENEKQSKKEEEEDNEVVEGFNEEEWLQLYDQEHPKKEVPEEITLDVDGDFDVEEEGGNEGDKGEEEEGEEEEES